MPWARLDDRFPSNRKVRPISDSAFRLYVSAICWSSENLTDGVIAAGELRMVSDVRNPQARAVELVKCGLWEEIAGVGWRIHDYHDYNPTRDQVRSARDSNAARQQAFRDRRKSAAKGDRNAVTNRGPERETDANATRNEHQQDFYATVTNGEDDTSPQVAAIRNAVSNTAPSRPVPSPTTNGPQRESPERSTGAQPQALSLINSAWQPSPDDIRTAQQARTADGRPVLTGQQLADMTRRFVRRMTSDQRTALPDAWGARWQDWAERERPEPTGQASLLVGLPGGKGPLWPHEQQAASPATPLPPPVSDRLAQIEAAIAADADTG